LKKRGEDKSKALKFPETISENSKACFSFYNFQKTKLPYCFFFVGQSFAFFHNERKPRFSLKLSFLKESGIESKGFELRKNFG